MTETMLQFVEKPQAYPGKRAPQLRAEDFREIADRYAVPTAEDQAARCSQCGVPYCSVHCPLHNHIPDWLRLTAEGRLREAYELSNATSTMPEICGRICPQDRLCEGNCVIEFSGHGAVTIGSVEKFITDTAWEEGWVEPLAAGPSRGQSVGVVGAGPAGLAAAEYLRGYGYEVHVYDRYDRAGGLLTYGIPGFKLEKHVVMRRVERLKQGGIVFHEGFEVGRDASLDELRQRHDGVLIATGVYKPRAIKAPGVGSAGVVDALDFLTASNRKGFGDAVPAFDDGSLNAEGKHVVVIGGGDTAMDCVRTAVRQGAASVKCLYRRDRANMPGSQREVANAEEEGVEFVWLSAPEAFAAAETVTSVKASRMRLGAPDASGRRAPEIDPAGGFDVPADLVIKALGFDAEDLPTLFGTPELGVTRWGTLLVGKTLMTSLDGVFAAGDIVRGASLVVWAIRDGRDVSAAMHKWLKAKGGEREGGGVKNVMIALALACTAPVSAQTATPVAATTPDPARVAVARKLMDQIMPPATRDQMMRSLMASMSQTMLGTIRQSPELATALEKLPGARGVFDRFMQRQMDAGTQDLIANLPGMLDAMANAYARRFTLAQLNDLTAFFATPTGRAYIEQSPTVMTDPDFQAWMSALMTRSMQRLPEQMAVLKAEIEALEKKGS